MKNPITILALCLLQCACASVGTSEAQDPLLSYEELGAEIRVVRTPVDETLADASDWNDDFWAAE